VGSTAVGLSIIISGIALATHFTYEHKASTYRGSGSDTTYDMMVKLDALYNASVGCKSVNPDPAAQTFDFKCQAEPSPFPTAAPFPDPVKANYDHDVVTEAYPFGSSLGLKQLTNQGLSNVATVDFARSSRAPKSGDSQNLRFVGYARDGLSWVCYKQSGSGCSTMPANAAGMPNLTQAQIKDIYSCVITNWSQVGGASVPIKVFQAQSGSGTRSTWDGFITGATSPAGCRTDIFENAASAIPTADRVGAIFYYSFGRYTQQTPPGEGTQIGQVDGVKPDATTIGSGTFPFSRLLYNAIRHSFTGTPSFNANQEVRDYVDVAGFLCKGPGQHETNPVTGNNYRTDIENVIKGEGFVPIPFGGPTGAAPLTFSSFCRVPVIPT